MCSGRIMRGIALMITFWFMVCCVATGTLHAAERTFSVPASPELICPLLNGQKMPAATLRTVDDTPFDLSAAIAKKPTILIFYRGGW